LKRTILVQNHTIRFKTFCLISLPRG